MEIDGVKHGLLLIIEDESGDEVLAEYFPGLAELNVRLDELWKDDRSFEWEATLSFVEVVDGVYGGRSIEHPLDSLLPLEKWEVAELIDDEISVRTEINEMFADGRERTRITYAGRSDEPLQKRAKLGEYAYVCPRCLEELDDCACAAYPFYLIQIDRGMLAIVRTLNKKGYTTTGCCAGHVGDKGSIHVNFEEPYDFAVKTPEGSTYWRGKKAVDFGLLENPSDEDYLAYQKNALTALSEWADALPPVCGLEQG